MGKHLLSSHLHPHLFVVHIACLSTVAFFCQANYSPIIDWYEEYNIKSTSHSNCMFISSFSPSICRQNLVILYSSWHLDETKTTPLLPPRNIKSSKAFKVEILRLSQRQEQPKLFVTQKLLSGQSATNTTLTDENRNLICNIQHKKLLDAVTNCFFFVNIIWSEWYSR